MRLTFTKMQGAGNDFVVLDGTRAPVELTPDWIRRLADRRFGVGADQILVVERSERPDVDFRYRIFNGGSGDEVELRAQDDGRVTVDMGAPVFELERVPFEPRGLVAREEHGFPLWPLEIDGARIEVAVLSMGNPHAVQRVADVAGAPVASQGPRIESDPHFPRRVNAGFMEIVDRGRIRLRVFERGTGETLACGTGACAAVVSGIRRGLLDARVDVETRGGLLTIEWAGGTSPVLMTGPAETVFEGEIEL